MEALHTSEEAPQISLEHLQLLTDDVGIIQHSLYGIPRRDTGYTTDDNARALTVVARCSKTRPGKELQLLASTYLAFLQHAQEPSGWFLNVMDYDRTWKQTKSSDQDVFGRAFWALAEAAASRLPEPQKAAARHMLGCATGAIPRVSSTRAIALLLIGCAARHQFAPQESLLATITSLAENLCDRYDAESSHGWHWFEPDLTYGNARLPHALFAAAKLTRNTRFLRVAELTARFLTEATFAHGVLHPIGNHGWYAREGVRAHFDQQPIDAAASVELYLEAFEATGQPDYYHLARTAYSWYLGKNAKGAQIASPETGACYDGLTPEGVNLNQGAEACTTFLMATLALASVNPPV